MTPVQAAHRLGVHETAVRTVDDRESDSVVTLRDGTRMLVSPTTARAYVPEVDDADSVAAQNLIDREKVLSYVAEPGEKAKTPVKRTQGKAK